MSVPADRFAGSISTPDGADHRAGFACDPSDTGRPLPQDSPLCVRRRSRIGGVGLREDRAPVRPHLRRSVPRPGADDASAT